MLELAIITCVFALHNYIIPVQDSGAGKFMFVLSDRMFSPDSIVNINCYRWSFLITSS